MYLSAISSRLLLYDTNTWDLKKNFMCSEGLLRDISWSDDGKYLLQVNSKGLVEILSPADQDIRSLQHIPLKDTWSACFHRDGHRNVAIGTKTGNVMIWDTKNKTIIKSFPTPPQQNCVNIVSFNSKNSSVAAAMPNAEAIIYSTISNIAVLSIKLAHSRNISAMKFHHESRSLLGLAMDEGHVVMKDITTSKDKVFYENVHASPVTDIAYSLINKDVMLSSGFDKIVNVYDIRVQTVVSSIRTSYTLTSIAVNHENQVALGTKNGVVVIYDLRDFKSPLKVMKCQEEICKVAFQPARKKLFSNEFSIKEDTDITSTPHKGNKTPSSKTSDLFYVNSDTPVTKPSVEQTQVENHSDSFLVMVGLDKSNNMLETDANKLGGSIKKSDTYELQYNNLTNEYCKVSTPINNRILENPGFQPSPVVTMEESNYKINGNIDTMKPLNSVPSLPNNAESRITEELRDFIKLSLADAVADNRNYFLHMMMVLTKQKLFLEKQLKSMNDNIQSLVENQNALLEINRKLAIEIDQLKQQRNSFNY